MATRADVQQVRSVMTSALRSTQTMMAFPRLASAHLRTNLAQSMASISHDLSGVGELWILAEWLSANRRAFHSVLNCASAA